MSVAQQCDDGLHDGPIITAADTERLGDCSRDRCAVAQLRKLDPPDAAGEVLALRDGERLRQAVSYRCPRRRRSRRAHASAASR